MKVHLFVPNIDITFYCFEAGHKLDSSRSGYLSSIAIELLLQDGQSNLCGCFLFDHDRSRLNYFADDGQHALTRIGHKTFIDRTKVFTASIIVCKQDYPADFYYLRFSPPYPPVSITVENASDTRRVNTPFPIHILYRYGLSKGMMPYNFRNTQPILIKSVSN